MRYLILIALLATQPALACDGGYVLLGMDRHAGGDDVYVGDDGRNSDWVGTVGFGYQHWFRGADVMLSGGVEHRSDPFTDDGGEETIGVDIRLFTNFGE